MGKNRFLDDILSEVQEYYNQNKIVGGAKSRPELYLQFSNLMATVATLFNDANMSSSDENAISVAIASAATSSSSYVPSSSSVSKPTTPGSSDEIAAAIAIASAAASNSSSLSKPTTPGSSDEIAAAIAIASAAASSSSSLSKPTTPGSSDEIAAAIATAIASTTTTAPTAPVTPTPVPAGKYGLTDPISIIKKAKDLSETLKGILDQFIKDKKEEQGDPDVETGKLILGEIGKPNAILLSVEGDAYLPGDKNGLTNDDIIFRK
jgi:hypothetical protein